MRKNNKGITLVALIITIIVMLILVAVSISVVIRSNILNSAKNAAKQTEAAIENESQIENNIKIGDETVDEYIANLGNDETDTTPPTVTIVADTGMLDNNCGFNVSVTITDDNNVDLSKCKLVINKSDGNIDLSEFESSSYQITTTNQEFSNIYFGGGDGQLYIHVLAVDVAGNTIQVCQEGPCLYECCFVAGSQVQYNLAGDTKAIEEFKTGDSVVSYNIETGEFYIAKVNKLIINPDATKMAKVYLENGEMLDMTDYHPLYTSEGFKSITNHNGLPTLEEGDLAKTIEGYSKITKIERYTVEPMATYNLDVQDFDEVIDNNEGDNFLVNGVVAHNCPV